ncbi:MAG: hypothetical protein AAB289_13330, partial [Chloroflexota bacterium]
VIEILAETVALEGEAILNASGDRGGGQINIGGSYQGKGPLPNAEQVFTGAQVKILADALQSGDGGAVILWANELNRYYGHLSAQGGPQGGAGGFAEVSGKSLVYRGQADLRAPMGKMGTLLLDPVDGSILQGSGDGDDVNSGAGSELILDSGTVNGGDPTPTTIFESELEGMLAAGNVSIQMTNNLTIADLSASGGDGILGAAGATGTLTLSADSDNAGGGAFTMNTANTIRTDGDNIIIHGASVVLGRVDTTGSGGATAGGSITIQAGAGGVSLNGDLKALGAAGDINLTSIGAVTQNAGVISGDVLTLDHGGGTGNYILDGSNLLTALAVTNLPFDGNLQFTNNQNFSVGAITTSNNKNITLRTTAGTLSITGDLNVGTSATAGESIVRLDAAGAVTQGAGDTITGSRLDLAGAGNFTLNENNNAVAVLGSTATGNISYTDNDALNLLNQAGNFTGGDTTITHGGALTISSNLLLTGFFTESQTGNGDVNLNAG